MVTVENRRQRARDLQRKSRAHRRAHARELETRIQALSQALDEVVNVCLQMSDAVIFSLGPKKDDRRLRTGIQPFIAKVLETARFIEKDRLADECTASNEDKAKAGQRVEEVETSQSVQRGRSTLLDSSDTLGPSLFSTLGPTDTQWSPRFTYGILPEIQPLWYGPPSDISVYLPSTSLTGVTIGATLFWNTLFFAHETLVRYQEPFWRQLFQYSLRFSSITTIVERIQYRLQYKPEAVALYVSDLPRRIISAEQDSERNSRLLLGTVDVGMEVLELTQHHLLISQAMSAANDNVESYLDPAGVERYLFSRWGITLGASEQSAMASTVDGGHQVIQELVSHSRCLGDRIGWAVNAVDEIALKHVYARS